MKYIPILFSTPIVQAILEGRKTMTRRIVKPQPPSGFSNFGSAIAFVTEKTLNHSVYCPYGKPGDILWVRESCCYVMLDHAHDLLEGSKDNNQWVYKASMHNDWMEYAKEKYNYKWKPSIHMPKEACRLFLQVKSVRIEKLQNITERDAIAEGVQPKFNSLFQENRWEDYANVKDDWRSPISSFQSLWAKINGFNSWDENPWVWVIEFERIEKPIDFK